MAFATIIYNEGDQSSYTAIEVEYVMCNGKSRKKYFKTGDPVIDYYDFKMWVGNQKDDWFTRNECINWSSSYGYFFMDGKRWIERYFDPNTWEFISKNILLKMPISKWNQFLPVLCLFTHQNFGEVKEYYLRHKGLPLKNLTPPSQQNEKK